MSSSPKWALVIDENSKTSAIVKTKNLSSSNSSIRVISLSNKKSSLESNKTLKSNKELEVLDDSSDELSSDDNDDSSYDEDSSSGDSSSEDEVIMRCSASNKSKKKHHTFVDNGSSSTTFNSQFQQQQTSHMLNEVMRLKKKVKRLKKEKAKVVKMNWKLQESLPKMIDLFSKYQQPSSTNTSSNNNKSSTSAVGTSQSRTLRLSATSASHQTNSNQDPLIVHPQQQPLNPDVIRTQPAIDNNAIFQNGERGNEENNHCSVGLLFSADDLLEFLTQEQLANACRKNAHYKKVISNIMECLFTEEEMKTSSVTGINTSKQPLDIRKSSALINFIQAHFPHVSVAQVKQRMGFKLRDKRKMCHQR